MAVANPVHRLTEAEYLEIERHAPIKSEFLDGEMLALSGGTSAHSLIAANLIFAMRTQPKECGCRVYTSDMRVKVRGSGLYTYPDVSVACAPYQFDDEQEDTLLNPIVIVEILSDCREAYDRGKKFELYRQLPSLREYLLVNQHQPIVEQHIRQDRGEWLLRAVAGLEGKLSLPSISITLSSADVFIDVRFVPAPPPAEKPDHRSYF